MDRTQKSGRGCLFYACGTGIIVIIALFIGTYFGTRKALNTVITKYTGTAPVEIPELKLSEAEKAERVEALDAKLESAVETGGTVALDDIDLNLLLARTPDVSKFADQIHLRVEADQIKAEVSMPLDQFEEWKKVAERFRSGGLTGRYLNATLSLVPSFQNQNVQLDLTDIEVNGEFLPDTFTGKVDLEKVTEEANRTPEAREVIKHIEGIKVSDGYVKIQLKPDSGTTSTNE